MKNPSSPKASHATGVASAKPSSDSIGANRRTIPARIGLWITLAAALAYCIWLGAHWLPLGYSDKELAASASRVWDVKRELTAHGVLPWWTPYFMSGSGYGLNYARGFYLVPWLLFSTFTSLQAAGKLMALVAMFASAVAMYFCARHFLRHEWAAVLAALAFMLHPEQIIRAAGAEHITISLFFPFIPLLWLTFARMLESGRFRDGFWCALTVVGAIWTDNKQAVVQFVFLGCYLAYWLWTAERRRNWLGTLKSCMLTGFLAAVLGIAIIVPGLVESKYVKLFYGDPVEAWQKNYAFKSLFGLVDRDGALTRDAIQGVSARLQSGGYRPTSEQERAEIEVSIMRVFGLLSDSPEKYAGIVLLLVMAATTLFNRQRLDRWSFWFFITMLLASAMLSTGLSTVWSANWSTASAFLSLGGVPQSTRVASLLAFAAVVVFLTVFYRRKLTTPRKIIIAGGALTFFLFFPAFKLLAMLPLFKEIRAPFVFYDLPAVFFEAVLSGFFVTDVLGTEKWRAHVPKIVAGVALLMLLDYWPYQKATKDNGVPERTLKNLEATYAALRSDPDWVKTYSLSGRYFHLLGPMWSGKPQVWEAFYNWMAPLGTGLLNRQASSSWDNHRDFLNLVGARYIVFDKTDPDNAGNAQLLALYRKTFPIALENDDFAVFRNATAHAYVTAYARACLFDGDVRHSPRLALALAAGNWPLVHSEKPLEAAMIGNAQYEIVYFFHGEGHETMVRPGLLNNLSIFNETTPPRLPSNSGEVVQLSGVTLTREDSQKVRIRLNAPRDCLAVIAESYYPFWRAEVDGRPAEVLRVSCALMGVNAPAGAHEIVLRYEPPRAYALAGVISLLALIGCAAAAVRNRSSRSERDS